MRLTMLIAFSAISLGVSAALTYDALNRFTVTNPAYLRVLDAKDLLADILPPPAYILEPYLVAELMEGARDPRALTALDERMQQLHAAYDERIAHWSRALPDGPLKQTLISDTRTPAVQFFDVVQQQYLPALAAGDRTAAARIREDVLASLYQQHREAIDRAVSGTEQMSRESQAQVKAAIARRTSLQLWLTGIMLAAGMALALTIRSGVVRSLHETVKALDRVADGDLTARVRIVTHDEMGHIGLSLNQTLESIQKTMQTIDSRVSTLTTASDQLAGLSQTLSANAEETAAQSNVVSTASEEISRNVQSVASATEQMAVSVQDISKATSRAVEVTTQAVQVAGRANATVRELGETSTQISDVVKVITSIAEQTNLLALNATIEAARSGEVGRGFAVVANEVKELAKETAKSTVDIAQRVEGIQSGTRSVVEAIEQIGTIISHINDMQGTVASAVEEQSAMTSEIGRSAAAGARGTMEIAQNITGVVAAAHGTTSGASETARAADDVHRVAGELREAVARFRC